jgi:hypothetical protein
MSHISKLGTHRTLLLTALLTQLAAIITGAFIIDGCSRDNRYVEHHFWRALWSSIVGPFVLMPLIAPITVVVLAAVFLLVLSGLSWTKVRSLWIFGILLWGVWWVYLNYALCSISND